MINPKNKAISFFLAIFLSVVSWTIIIAHSIIKISSAFRLGISDIDTFSFIFTTVLLTIYIAVIAFKIRSVAYFPVLLILLHISTLNGSSLSIFFVIIDVILMFLLNTGGTPITQSKQTYYTSFDTGSFRQQNKNNQSQSDNTTQRKVDNDNVFDAEFNTKE